jgi:hypothetical protein
VTTYHTISSSTTARHRNERRCHLRRQRSEVDMQQLIAGIRDTLHG